MLDFTTAVFSLVSEFIYSFSEYFLWYLAFTALGIVVYIVYRFLLRW